MFIFKLLCLWVGSDILYTAGSEVEKKTPAPSSQLDTREVHVACYRYAAMLEVRGTPYYGIHQIARNLSNSTGFRNLRCNANSA